MQFSVIVPVYNRPQETDELLSSLAKQTFTDFEVIIVEDGSDVPCCEACIPYNGKLKLKYYEKENSGPGLSRNYGAQRASGDFLIFLDSDVILPPGYMEAVEKEQESGCADAFGGPDRAHSSFTDTQKAISYAMTSFFTTGGIRGSSKAKMDKFYPRSFNMGIAKDVFDRLGGFSAMRFGEDIDLSIRIFKAGYRCRLFSDAWVWHKRRTDFKKFFRQVFNSGIARIALYRKYPESLKAVHLLPSFFTLGTAMLLIAAAVFLFRPLVSFIIVSPIILYCLLIAADSYAKNRSLAVALKSIPAAFVQLAGYGTGFIAAWWRNFTTGKEKLSAFNDTFYD